jgi:uncharacterized YigZ family protein
VSEIIDSYKTLAAPSEGLYKEKGSKFIALAFPVASEEEIKEALENTRKKYHDARHHCYAWALGVQRENYRENDDGEPNNSAGKPILGRLESNDLTQLLIIVVRYFGGTKLGVGGLINAYRSAAEEAIQNGKIVERKMKMYFEISFSYDQMNEVMQAVKNADLEQIEHDFALTCKLKLACPNAAYSDIKDVFLNIENVEIEEMGVE